MEILRTSRDTDELKHVWVEWRKVSGEECRSMFEHYVALSNEAANLNSEYESVVRYIYMLHFDVKMIDWTRISLIIAARNKCVYL